MAGSAATISAENVCGAGGSLKELVAAQRGEPRQGIEIAANAETSIAGKIAGAIVDRKPDNSTANRPPPSTGQSQGRRRSRYRGGDRLEDAAGRDRARTLGDLAPRPAEAGGGAAPIRRVNSPGSSAKRPSASIRHVKRSGCWRGSGDGSSSRDGASAGWDGAESIAGDGSAVGWRCWFVGHGFNIGRRLVTDELLDRAPLSRGGASAFDASTSGIIELRRRLRVRFGRLVPRPRCSTVISEVD